MSPLCYKCLKIPSMILEPQNINVHCSCGYNESLPYDKYLHQLDEKFPHCVSHQEKKGHKYCINCKKWLCESCFKRDEHKEHKISSEENETSNLLCKKHSNEITHYCPNCMEYLCDECKENHNEKAFCVLLKDIFSAKEMKEFLDKLKDAELYIDVYCKEIKDKYIKKLENCYANSKTRNKNILQTFILMSSSYIPNQINDYYLLNNLKINNNLHLRKYDKEKDIFQFFNENIILKTEKTIFETKVNIDIKQIKPIKTINEESEINFILPLVEHRIAVCLSSGVINIYNPNSNFNLDFSIQNHKDSIKCISQLNNGRIISSSSDNTIRIFEIYDYKNYKEVQVINENLNYSSKFVILPFNRIASVSGEKKIKIWSSKSPFHCIEILYGRVSVVLFLSQNKYLISGNYDKDTSHIHIWDINTYESKSIIENISFGTFNSIAELGENRIIIGGFNGIIKIINILKASIESTIINNELGKIISVIPLKNGHVLFGNFKGTIYEYEMNEYTVVKKKEKIHEEGLTYFINWEKSKMISFYSNHFAIWE